MKKTILSFAVLLVSSLGITAVAQTTQPDQKACPAKTEKAKSCCKKDAPKYCPFDGLNLTDKQKSELKSICPQKPSKEQVAKAKSEKQAQKKACRENRMQARRDYLAKVKNILTPEQYVQFLENSYVDQIGKGAPRKGKFGKAQAHHGKKAHNGKGRKARMNRDNKQAANDSTFYIDNGLVKVFPYHAQR